MQDARTIEIVDTTLRDGEQSPNIVFSAQDKLNIATALDKAGVTWIEAGVPVMGEEEQEAMKMILSAGLQAKVIAWNRALKNDILSSVSCGFSHLHISVPVSDLHIEQKLKKSREWVLENLKQSILLAQSFGCTVSVGAEDASRGDREYFLQVANIAAELGAVRIRYADTVGCLNPLGVHSIFQELIPRCPLPVEVHMHNDFGLANANTLVALAAGAELASTTIGGIGERAGNAALEEVVTAWQVVYGMKCHVNRSDFPHLSHLVMQAGNKDVFDYKPIIGNAFTVDNANKIA
ncbi:homocitrate synthase [Pelosinus baikalensis]|uniref:Homocitrate synthase n=1 Tax=Pelosinus baikalensis TaxID=2892015 RepID=A0ABS8HY22_9FIRM|nr:homocitrate synthase [Pelosinus baikalensis]MCC5467027.1 homocitrate synthase [Pelosinus baikalensis]